MLDQVHSILIQKIIDASDEDKRRELISKLIKKPKKVKKEEKKTKRLDYDKKGKWSKELIIEVLSQVAEEQGKLTNRILKELRRLEPQNYPAPTTVILRFGSWNNAKKAVGGKAYPPYLAAMGESDPKGVSYFLNMYHQGGIKTRAEYIYAREKFPEVVPSYYYLVKMFGNFKRFKKVAEIDSSRDQLDKLLQLSIKLNRFPSKFQCKSNEIDIDLLIERFNDLKELRGFILELKIAIESTVIEKKFGATKIAKKARNNR